MNDLKIVIYSLNIAVAKKVVYNYSDNVTFINDIHDLRGMNKDSTLVIIVARTFHVGDYSAFQKFKEIKRLLDKYEINYIEID